MKLRFLNIKDKKIISNDRFCSPHYIPHKFPMGEKVKDEPCHIHKNSLRMFHHKIFCKILDCPNYSNMIETYMNSKNLK